MRYIIAAVIALSFLAACSTPYDTYKEGMDGKDNTGSTEKKESLKYEFEGNTIRCTGSEFMVEASCLSPGQADLYFSMFKGGVYKNPFAPGAFLVFSITVENRSTTKVMSYNPRMTIMHEGNGEPVEPKDYASLYALFELSQTEDIEKRMEAFKAACYDTTVTINPGERVQRLLVYPRSVKPPKNLVLVVNALYLDYKSHTMPFAFKDLANLAPQ